MEQAKQYIQKTKFSEHKVSQSELIMEKIAQLKRNPHVSLSWRPTLQARGCMEEDGEYVCGRCNVLCDDMEDYMDHLQDCLTMTSVTLEPAPTPPRRLLKLPCQTVAFGSRESGHSRYLINQNLIAKLQAYLPNSLVKTSQPLPHQFKPPNAAPPGSTGQTFRDLLDDDFGYESHESVDIQTAGSSSPVSPATWHSEAPHSSRELSAIQGKVSMSNTTKGTTQPMVMIPMDSKINLSVSPDHQLLKKLSDHSQCGEETTKTNSSLILAASPLGLLLDQDDIKMEVEEEVVEDHFECLNTANRCFHTPSHLSCMCLYVKWTHDSMASRWMPLIQSVLHWWLWLCTGGVHSARQGKEPIANVLDNCRNLVQ
ncbi:uncharacterized protein LOC123514579 isoform X2 [Portunus trituberculatus]|uniref:uncharacterized protein LOC123514579 isoform X2 n=1 Tax=Portunus trituberculatus TaxID=210409 RepID=UPI001E1D11C2|nr:uncharacterized protein LOC123514579 isoform X2 [Portunus trituberculatus]XP_045128475.1 uncharacterized protein LOC123514579 isoform X2 [Portunus trituberculatus]XP_045128476.1 uncharacterized protein LOC123514579 isoform X2 [Portunus trituberculatus]